MSKAYQRPLKVLPTTTERHMFQPRSFREDNEDVGCKVCGAELWHEIHRMVTNQGSNL